MMSPISPRVPISMKSVSYSELCERGLEGVPNVTNA